MDIFASMKPRHISVR